MYLFWNNQVVTLLGELSVYDRFNAMKQLDPGGGSNFLTNKWAAVLGWSVIVLLLILLAVVRKARLETERLSINRRFDEYADRLSLSGEERSIVEAVSRRAKVKHKDTIFTSRDAFDRGLIQLMRELFAVARTSAERRNLHTIIFSIKEKLGFAKSNSKNGLSNRVGKEKTSRQIPEGTALSISLLQDVPESWTEAEVVRNGEFEILLETKQSISCKPGDVWKIRYVNAAVVWEFEAITMGHSQKGLELNHSERIRYVNRRRFNRVLLDRPARIASFPIFQQNQSGEGMDVVFSAAVVKEIAGTGLQIATKLAVSIRQRVLVVFELDSGRILQDVGEVRDVRESRDGVSIAVELIGLNTKAMDELMCSVNRMASVENEDMSEMDAEVAECQS